MRRDGLGCYPANYLLPISSNSASKEEAQRRDRRYSAGAIAFPAAGAKFPATRATLPEDRQFGRGASEIAPAEAVERG